MLFDFTALPPSECYKLMVSTITPRPIAWVVSQNKSGRLNAAPFSFFNAFSGDPSGSASAATNPGGPRTRERIFEKPENSW
jgi:flavin reductase (DIM6/NTAB) family NADH-FMN oxidoreductase RutF